MKKSFAELLRLYDVPVPRYTSYPTVPAWSQTPTSEQWFQEMDRTLASPSASWSLYLHIPFCETMCTFCGCNTIITKDHKKESEYVNLLLKEWSLYLQRLPILREREFKHIHLGGGSPTFLSPEELVRLATGIFSGMTPSRTDFEASIEVDPRRTTAQQLEALRALGFNRVSLGVQDFNERVQKLINRFQPYSVTENITKAARDLGYESVNFDLIYGLPAQDLEMMERTLEQTLRLRPDRIAFYSFALVPWIKPAQRLFKDSDLPSSEQKRALYERAREVFLAEGYIEVGMDHFALPSDSLFAARERGELHRNFMGYTDKKTDLLLGLGVSSISESHGMFHQNEKLLPKYQEAMSKGHLPTHRGHVLTTRDQEQRRKILRLMTQFELSLPVDRDFSELKSRLTEFISQGLVELNNNKLRILPAGKPFLRNICSIFDDYIVHSPDANQSGGKKLFSKSI